MLNVNAGDERYATVAWKIQRSTRNEPLLLIFNTVENIRDLPIEEACGCGVCGSAGNGLYFGRTATWPKALNEFMKELDLLDEK